MEAKKAEMETKISEAMSSIKSESAKQLATQIKSIHENLSLTPAQEKEQIKAILDGASDSDKQELKQIVKDQFAGFHDGPHGHGGPHGPRHTTPSA